MITQFCRRAREKSQIIGKHIFLQIWIFFMILFQCFIRGGQRSENKCQWNDDFMHLNLSHSQTFLNAFLLLQFLSCPVSIEPTVNCQCIASSIDLNGRQIFNSLKIPDCTGLHNIFFSSFLHVFLLLHLHRDNLKHIREHFRADLDACEKFRPFIINRTSVVERKEK